MFLQEKDFKMTDSPIQEPLLKLESMIGFDGKLPVCLPSIVMDELLHSTLIVLIALSRSSD